MLSKRFRYQSSPFSVPKELSMAAMEAWFAAVAKALEKERYRKGN
jgi:hypothetical protein